MKTLYELLNYKADLCRIAGDNCMRLGAKDMATVWYSKASNIVDIALSMSIEYAESVIV